MQEISGDELVRSLAGLVRENGKSILAAARALSDQVRGGGDGVAGRRRGSLGDEPARGVDSQNGRNNSIHSKAETMSGSNHEPSGVDRSGLTLGSLLSSALSFNYISSGSKSASSPGVSNSTASSASSTRPIAKADAFTIDPYHLAYLEQRFRSSPRIREYVESNVIQIDDRTFETEIDTKPAIEGAPSPAVTPNTRAANSYFSMLWSSSSTLTTPNPPTPVTTVEQDLESIYHFFEGLEACRLAPVRRNHVIGFDPPLHAYVNLRPFSSLLMIEFDSVHPNVIGSWGTVRKQLHSLSCRNSLKDAEELVTVLEVDQRARNQTKGAIKAKFHAIDDEDENVGVLLPRLTHLQLPGNAFTQISPALIQNVPRCAHLDLSHNSLQSVPAILSALAELDVLNLASNKISSLADAEDSVRNVTTLVLTSNALENLLGVETLALLRSIDISDNKIWDVYEIGRLAALMDVEDIRIARNPLTKLPNYRINIFTYFKSRALGLFLDGSQPSVTERNAIKANLTVAAIPSSSRSPPSSGNAMSAASKSKSIRSRDTESARDHKSHRSGDRSEKASTTPSGRKKKKKVRDRKEGDAASSILSGLNGVDPNNISGTTSVAGSYLSGSQIVAGATSAGDKSILPSTSPGPVRRTHRFAEIEQSIRAKDAGRGTDESQLSGVDAADLVVSRSGKKSGKVKSKKPKENKIHQSKERLDKDGASISVVSLSSAQVLSPEASSATVTTSDGKNAPSGTEDKYAATPQLPSPVVGGDVTVKPVFKDGKAMEQSGLPITPPTDIVNEPSFIRPEPDSTETGTAPLSKPPLPSTSSPSLSGTHIGNIGPYRRIFEYAPPAAGQVTIPGGGGDTGSNGVRWVSQGGERPTGPLGRPFAPLARKSSSGPDVQAGIRDELPQVGRLVGESQLQSPHSYDRSAPPAGRAALPSLRFGVPVTTAANVAPSHNYGGSHSHHPVPVRRPSSPSPSIILSRPLRTGTGLSVSSRSAGGRSVATAPVTTVRRQPNGSVNSSVNTFASLPSWMIPHGSFAPSTEIPSAPTIPFRSFSNALKLHLSMNVLQNPETEKCLCWIPGSAILQLPENSLVESERSLSRLASAAMREKPNWCESSYLPAQRPSYLLLSSKRLYFFDPRYRFPYSGSRRYNIHGTDGEVSYDVNIAAHLRLIRSIRVRSIARIDVGPNYQYVVIRHRVAMHAEPDSPSPTATGFGSGIHPLGPGGLGPRPAHSKAEAGKWESIVFMTRDRTVTLELINHVRDILAEQGPQASASSSSLELQSKINDETEWADHEMQNYCSTLAGQEQFGLDPSWTVIRVNQSSKFDLGLGSQWLRKVFSGTWDQSSDKVPKMVDESSNNNLAVDLLPRSDLFDLEQVRQQDEGRFGKLYIQSGLLTTQIASEKPQASAVVLTPLAVTSDSKHIYLISERLDVWPPLHYPPEMGMSEWVNAAVPDVEPAVNSKGLLADVIGLISRVVDVGNIAQIKRCERWKTWRWFGTGLAEGALVQNGLIGVWSRDRSVRSAARDKLTSGRREWVAGERGHCSEGFAAGWSWWVRVVFARPPQAQQPETTILDSPVLETDSSPNPTPNQPIAEPHRPPQSSSPTSVDERHWDLVFTSLESADEFLHFLRLRRGIKVDMGSQDILLSQHHPDAGGLPRVQSLNDGIEFIVGDD
ncbi:hypothetical protein DFS34DRAFT_683759 [Phlyctochytrium arcticum]|nr:hypothetical protein DFS34DRAFT_683759 [Phlyctochytrium arcticum]